MTTFGAAPACCETSSRSPSSWARAPVGTVSARPQSRPRAVVRNRFESFLWSISVHPQSTAARVANTELRLQLHVPSSGVRGHDLDSIDRAPASTAPAAGDAELRSLVLARGVVDAHVADAT